MLKNYLKVAYRSLVKHRFYTLINILGLTIGLTASTLICLYVLDEISTDRFHADADRIYRVGVSGKLGEQSFNAGVACAPMAATMVEEFPEVESAVRLNLWDNVTVKFEDKSFVEKNYLLADSNFFSFFTFPLIEGDPETALRGANKLVIDENVAVKYFGWKGPGDTSPLGKMVQIGNGDRVCEITGIAANPEKSHIPFDVIMSMESWSDSKSTIWVNNNYFTYFKIQAGADIAETNANLESVIEKYVGPQLEQFLQKNLEQLRSNGDYYQYYTQAFLDIYFSEPGEAELAPGGNLQYIYVLSATALFILLLACINFMNMATARATSRAKEVGIRKTIGGTRKGLSLQFLSESILISTLSVLPSILLVFVLLKPFNELAGKSIGEGLFLNLEFYGIILLAGVLIGLLAGIYPSFYLTAFKPVDVLKGKLSTGLKSSSIRSFLVIFQFWISITLVICTLVVFRQLDMMQSKSLGFNKEHVLVIDNARKLGSAKVAFRNDLMKYNEIISASISQSVPPLIQNNTVVRPNGTEQEQFVFIYAVDENHLETLGYELEQGRFFSDKFANDSVNIILNEAALQQIQWSDIEAKSIKTYFFSQDGIDSDLIGVVKDFNFESLKQNVRPLAFLYSTTGNLLSVRLSPTADVRDQISMIEERWKEATNGAPFEYFFIDQKLNELYSAEQKLSTLSSIFTGVAIFIACLGLFALATFTAEKRQKEIGIRKVMGASNTRIIIILTREFTRLVVFSFLLSIPTGYYLMNEWLQSFTYKINLSPQIFIIAGIGAVFISIITVSIQSYRAASNKPVNSLRSE